MKSIKRIVCSILIVLMVMTQLSTISFAYTDTQKQNIEKIIGVYDGSYTASQGITGLTLAVYRKQDILNDNLLLQKYADVANSCGNSYSSGSGKTFTAADIKEIVSQHSDEYIALFNFFPMVDENGVGPNPNVEEGLYTMTVTYNESTGKYDFFGSKWIQRNTYFFVDLRSVVLNEDVLSGDVYGEYASWLGTEYKDLGDVSVRGGKGHSGYRIDFENGSASLGINEKQQIKAVVKNSAGITATDAVNIHWFSNNENIAKITGTNWDGSKSEYALGTITGVSEGQTEVYAELDNKRIAVCTVVVSENGTIAPLEISTSFELVSQLTYYTEGNITKYKFEPKYKITAVIKNSDTNTADNVTVKLNLPETAALFGNGELTTSIKKLDGNESKILSWNIVVEGDFYDSTQVQYSVSAKSNQTAEIFEYKTIFVDPFSGKDNRIKYDKDVWNFTNTSPYYNDGYFINSEYYASLMNSISNIEKERIDSYLSDKWNGSCYGMSVVSALTKMNHLKPGNYHSGASELKELPTPKKSDEIYSLITYYHMTQKLDAYYTALNNILQLDEPQRLVALVNAVEKVKIGETPVVFSMWYMKDDYDIHSIRTDYVSGHAVLAYDVEYGEYKVKSLVDQTSTVYDKRVLMYNPNNNKKPLYLYINEDFSKWIVDGYCQNRTKEDGLYWYEGEGYFSFVDDVNIIDSINVEDSFSNYYSRLVTNTNTLLKINAKNKNGTLQKIDIQGMNIHNFSSKYIIAYVEGLTGDGISKGFGYFLPEDVTELTAIPGSENEVLDLEYQYPGILYTAKAKKGKSVLFSENNSVEMECDGEYLLTAVYDEGKYSGPWYYYSISGSTDSKIGLSQDKDGYTIVSGGKLNGVELTVKGKSDVIVRKIETVEESILIKSEDGAIVLYADTDDNGTFETNLNNITNDKESSNNDNEEESVLDELSGKYIVWIGIGAGVIFVILVIVIIVMVKKKHNKAQEKK